MATFVDFHIVQTLPPSNVNRDDTGSPKTAIYGGVSRVRVSSQAWKRATRERFNADLDPSEVGIRTLEVVDALAEIITQRTPELEERADKLARAAMEAVGFSLKERRARKTKEGEEPEKNPVSGFLVFLSARQLEALADAAAEASEAPDPTKAMKAAKVKDLIDRDHSIDISLFGRMVAQPDGVNVDASCQVAHALGTHAVEPEFDYFTAVDDAKGDDDDAGAGMIGTIEFSSSTIYRYATVSMSQLEENLGSRQAATRALQVFADAFVHSMPTGKQNTFANRTVPDAVAVMIRDDQPVNLVGAYETPVTSSGGHVRPAVERLVAHANDVAEGMGHGPQRTFVGWIGEPASSIGSLGERVAFDALGEAVASAVDGRSE